MYFIASFNDAVTYPGYTMLTVKIVKQSRYRPGVAQRVPGS